jgi:hypothetical protein
VAVLGWSSGRVADFPAAPKDHVGQGLSLAKSSAAKTVRRGLLPEASRDAFLRWSQVTARQDPVGRLRLASWPIGAGLELCM